jgi:dTDP-D-glucose 4,6-dehydratase
MVQSNIRLINTIIDKIEFHYPEYKRKREGARMEYIEFVKDRKGHDFKYELSTKHSLHAVKHQQGFFIEDTIKYYVEKYKA